MGYYDFNDHFWSPQEVCGKLPAKPTPKGFWRTRIVGIFAGVFSTERDRSSPQG